MHSAKLDSSIRLQRVLKVLQRGGKWTTRDIIRKARVCAVSACVSEIRDQGIQIECQRVGAVWLYWLL
jgi:hypothetical protein